MTTVDTLDEATHLKVALRLNTALEEQLTELRYDNERLRARIAALETVNVIVFGSSNKLGVALVASADPAGAAELTAVDMAFDVHREELKRKGVGYGIVEKVRLNELHATPFKTPSLLLPATDPQASRPRTSTPTAAAAPPP